MNQKHYTNQLIYMAFWISGSFLLQNEDQDSAVLGLSQSRMFSTRHSSLPFYHKALGVVPYQPGCWSHEQQYLTQPRSHKVYRGAARVVSPSTRCSARWLPFLWLASISTTACSFRRRWSSHSTSWSFSSNHWRGMENSEFPFERKLCKCSVLYSLSGTLPENSQRS